MIELGPGRTSLGGPTADVALEGVASGELHLWGDPARVERPAGSASLTVDGTEGEAFELKAGSRIEWAGVTLEFSDEAALVEDAPAPAAEVRAWRRLKAGVLADLGKGDKKAVKRWQEAVVRGDFDPDRAADEILAASPIADDDTALLERSARLSRDLLMQPTLRGARGAARGARKAGRNLFAMALSQLFIVLIFALLFTVGLLVARYEGVGIDALLDTVLPERTDGP